MLVKTQWWKTFTNIRVTHNRVQNIGCEFFSNIPINLDLAKSIQNIADIFFTYTNTVDLLRWRWFWYSGYQLNYRLCHQHPLVILTSGVHSLWIIEVCFSNFFEVRTPFIQVNGYQQHFNNVDSIVSTLADQHNTAIVNKVF